MNLGIIPVRLDSKRFPKKIIHPLNGKSIIQHVYDNAKQSQYLDQLIIAIDSEETKSHVDSSSETILTSVNHKSGTDRVAEFLKNLIVISLLIFKETSQRLNLILLTI